MDKQTYWSISNEPSIGFIAENTQKILEANKMEVKKEEATLCGFNPGGYGCIWVDDSASSLPAAMYLADKKYVMNFLDEALWQQQADGEIPATLNLEDRRGIHSTLETSRTMCTMEQFTVIALWSCYQVKGDVAYLKEDVQGVWRIRRAEDALAYILRHRWDEGHGLMKNVYTMDWGDVEAKASGFVENNDGLCQNAMLAMSARMLSDMWGDVGDQRKADFWRSVAETVKANVNRLLWDEIQGFYRPRIPATGCFIPYDDSRIFVLGGNTFAVQAGIASQSQADRIFAHAESCRIADGGLTISRVNYPDYPPIWRFPPMNEPPFYQNGCYWDWYGGRLVRSEFEHGHAAEAYLHLLQIARHQAEYPGKAFEWYRTDGSDGNPKTSAYTGSASVVAEAIIYGLFGLYELADKIMLQPRLRDKEGEIRLYNSLNGHYIYYAYAYSKGEIRIDYETDHNRQLKVKVLLPQDKQARSVRAGGVDLDYTLENVGGDCYVAFDTALPSNMVKISLCP